MATSEDTCPICSARESRAVGWACHYVEGEPAVPVRECGACGSSWAAGVGAGDEVYDAIYRHADEIVGYSRYSRYAAMVAAEDGSRSRLWELDEPYRAIWAGISRFDPSASVLEVGCGLGYISAALRRHGYRSIGLDASQVAIADARARFGDDYVAEHLATFASGNAGRFDVVIASELIEHLEDPIGFLRVARGALAPGGAVLLTTPNKEASPRSAVWATENPPVHLTWMGPLGLEAMADRAGFDAEIIWPTDHAARVAAAAGRPVLGSDLRPIATSRARRSIVELSLRRPRLGQLIGAGSTALRPAQPSGTTAALLRPRPGG